jgi:hypothetical protein
MLEELSRACREWKMRFVSAIKPLVSGLPVFLFGMLVMFVGFCAVYQHVFAKICKFDGNVWAGWMLVVVGAVSGVVAYIAYLHSQREKRIDRTLDLVRSWFLPVGRGPSPEESWAHLDDKATNEWLRAARFPTSKDYIETKRRCVYIHNYFDTVLAMIRNNLIEKALFFEHQRIIVRLSAHVLKRYYDFYGEQEGWDPARAVDVLAVMLTEIESKKA